VSQETTNRSFDDLAKGLATGTLSRGKAIRWMGGALLGAALASLPGVAWATDCRRLGRECRRDSQCCSRNCIRRGDDKVCGCPEGKSRCNDRCVNLKTNENHCGRCGNRCDDGEQCVRGECQNGGGCRGTLLTPVGGGDPICTCEQGCVDSCDACADSPDPETFCASGGVCAGNDPPLNITCARPCCPDERPVRFNNGTCAKFCNSDADCPAGCSCASTVETGPVCQTEGSGASCGPTPFPPDNLCTTGEFCGPDLVCVATC
jgi:hypothetical protein